MTGVGLDAEVGAEVNPGGGAVGRSSQARDFPLTQKCAR